jgi:hypothetical protein
MDSGPAPFGASQNDDGGQDLSHIHLQRRDEGLLRNVDLAELAHALPVNAARLIDR